MFTQRRKVKKPCLAPTCFYEIMLKNNGDTGICQVFFFTEIFSRPACAVALGKDCPEAVSPQKPETGFRDRGMKKGKRFAG